MKEVITEPLLNSGKYLPIPNITNEFIDSAIEFVANKISDDLPEFTDKFPAACCKGNVYPATENFDWTESFWTGMLWLAYEETSDEKYRKAAEIQLDSFKNRIDTRYMTGTHDLGFLYTLSCVAAYKITGDETAKETALKAADCLMERYLKNAGIIQAWGDLSDPEQSGRMIIDCLMNLPLLYWASEVTGDSTYKDAALSHARQSAQYLVRDDASAFHTFYMDPATGEPVGGKTAQGFSDQSSWAKGQAWGIYGFALSYRHTGVPEFLELSKKMANYFINRLPEDDVCYWDLIFTDGSEERDSSAAAIAVCGLLELYKHLSSSEDASVYKGAALNILRSLKEKYTSETCPESNRILMHGSLTRMKQYGYDPYIMISQVITKESLEDFSDDELFPIESVEYTDLENCCGYGPVKIKLKNGTEKTIDFDGIEGNMQL